MSASNFNIMLMMIQMQTKRIPGSKPIRYAYVCLTIGVMLNFNIDGNTNIMCEKTLTNTTAITTSKLNCLRSAFCLVKIMLA